MASRADLYDLLAIVAASCAVLAGLVYAYVVYVYDATTFVASVVLPLVVGSLIISVRRRRLLLFAFLAYFWAVIDDAPVFFDSVLTWPEVTRFHPFLPRLYMNIVIHALTIIFLYLTLREAMKGRTLTKRRKYAVWAFGFIALVLAYAQNIPLPLIQNIVQTSWYQFDVAEKFLSFVFLWLGIREATS